MRLYEYQTLSEAEDAKELITNEINGILDRDLNLLSKEERTIGRWFSLIGKDPVFKESKDQLSQLENRLADTILYISSYKTTIQLD